MDKNATPLSGKRTTMAAARKFAVASIRRGRQVVRPRRGVNKGARAPTESVFIVDLLSEDGEICAGTTISLFAHGGSSCMFCGVSRIIIQIYASC